MDCKTELLQIRTAVADGKMTADEAKLKIEEIRNFKKAEEKKQAMENAPIPEEKRGTITMSKIADTVKNTQYNTRARIDLNGTGRTKVTGLVKGVTNKSVRDYIHLLFGKDATTVVPAYSRYAGKLGPISEGGAYPDTAGSLGKVDLVPYTFGGKFMLSKKAQNLSDVDLENEIDELAWDEIDDTLCSEVFTGSGTGGHFKGLQLKTVGYTKTPTVGAALAATDLVELATVLADKNFKQPAIFMSPRAYRTICASFGSDAEDKVLAETLMRDKMVENIPVVITGYMNYGTNGTPASGDILVVGGDLYYNYGAACAEEMNIEKKPVAGNAYDSIDFEAYLAGEAIIPEDFFCITLK